MRRYALAALMLAATTLWACESGDTDCQADRDCFSGEYCDDGACLFGDRPANNANAANATNNSNSANSANSANSVSNNATDAGDAGTMNQLDMAPDMATNLTCIVDSFATCVDEEKDNNTWPGETLTSMTRGCPNDFVPLDMTVEGRMCQRENADIYGFIMYECEVSFVVEAILTPKTECDLDLIGFDVSGFPGRCDGDNPNLECEDLPDGTKRIRALIPGTPNGVGGSIYFYVETDPERSDIQFDYDLQIVVRQ